MHRLAVLTNGAWTMFHFPNLQCLNTTDAAVVRNTITRLPAPLAVRFLIDIVARLEVSPAKDFRCNVAPLACVRAHPWRTRFGN